MDKNDDSQASVKILILGESAVGKTSILVRYVDDKFEEAGISTLGVDYKYKIIKFESLKIKLQIWDTSGEEKYRSIARNFLRNAQGLLIVFDITNINSFAKVKDWIKDAEEYNENLKIILIGNKLDLENKRKVEKDIAINFANKIGLKYIETSAKNGKNIGEAFKTLIDLLFQGKNEKVILEEYGNDSQNTSLTIESEKGNKNIKKKCC